MRQFALFQTTAGRTNRSRPQIGKTLQYVVNILLVFTFIFPLLFMVSASLKPSNDVIFSDLQSIRGFLPVGNLTLNNYVTVFQVSPFLRFLLNSIFISTVSVVLGVFLNSMAAFALSRLKWKGQALVLTIIIATLIIPFETIAIPLLLLVNNLPNLSLSGGGLALTQGWFDTYQVQIIPFITSAFSIFLFYQLLPDLPANHHAQRRPGHGDRRHLHLLGELEFLSVAQHGHSIRRRPPDHGGDELRLPAEHAMGCGDGLRDVGHVAGAGPLPGLSESLRRQSRWKRCQRLRPQTSEGKHHFGEIRDEAK